MAETTRKASQLIDEVLFMRQTVAYAMQPEILHLFGYLYEISNMYFLNDLLLETDRSLMSY